MKINLPEEFHNTHEKFTEKAFNDSSLIPDRYVFVVTNLCNLRCNFCFQKKEKRLDALKAEDWISLAKQLPDYARVTFTGGEPLIFPDFKKVFSYIAKRFNCNIISNGLLLNKEKIDYFLSFPKFKVLSLSIDDIGNRIRGVKEEQWEHLKDMINYFHTEKKELNSDCILDIKSVIVDDTAEEMFNNYKYFREVLRCDTHAFQFLKGSPLQHADYMFHFEEIFIESPALTLKKFDLVKQQLELIREYNFKNRIISFLHPKIASLTSKYPLSEISYINNSNHIKERFFPCKYPWSSVHINFNGDLFPCLAVLMGNVKEKPLREIINGNNFTRFKNIIKTEGTVPTCNRCGWLKPVEKIL